MREIEVWSGATKNVRRRGTKNGRKSAAPAYTSSGVAVRSPNKERNGGAGPNSEPAIEQNTQSGLFSNQRIAGGDGLKGRQRRSKARLGLYKTSSPEKHNARRALANLVAKNAPVFMQISTHGRIQ